MQKTLARLAAIVLLAAVPAACETPVVVQSLPQITFTHKAPIAIAASGVTVVSTYQAPMKAPNIDHIMPTSPAAAIRRWAEDRLSPTGGNVTVRVDILQAPVIEEQLKIDKGLTGLVKNEQAASYTATASARVEVVDATGHTVGFSEATATRARTLAEDLTLNQREQAWFEMVEALMQDFDAEMEKQIRTHLSNWVR